MFRNHRYRKHHTGNTWEPSNLGFPKRRAQAIIHRLQIINEKYQYGFQQDLRFRANVFKRLKNDNKDLLNLFNAIQADDLYVEAQRYRTAAAHGTSAGEISNTVSTQRDVTTEVPELINGKLTKKTIKAVMVVAVGVGDYTKTETIMTNIEQYSKFSGLKIQEAINLME